MALTHMTSGGHFAARRSANPHQVLLARVDDALPNRRISAAGKAARSDTTDCRGVRAASENRRQTAAAASAACRARRPDARPRCRPRSPRRRARSLPPYRQNRKTFDSIRNKFGNLRRTGSIALTHIVLQTDKCDVRQVEQAAPAFPVRCERLRSLSWTRAPDHARPMSGRCRGSRSRQTAILACDGAR